MCTDDLSFSSMRLPALQLLIESAQLLEVTPLVKYTALSLFAHRFYASLSRFMEREKTNNWLLHPMRENNMQLFALVSIWISSKIHDSRSFSVQKLKTLANKSIMEQHFTARDISEAVSNYEIGFGKITFVFLEDLLAQFRGIAKVGELVELEACMDIMDLLYEKEEAVYLFSSPHALAAAILPTNIDYKLPTIISLIFCGPTLNTLLVECGPLHVKFATSFKEGDILEIVRNILRLVFEQ